MFGSIDSWLHSCSPFSRRFAPIGIRNCQYQFFSRDRRDVAMLHRELMSQLAIRESSKPKCLG